MDSLIDEDPRDQFMFMLNERIGKLEEDMFHSQEENKMISKELSDLKTIIYCQRMHVFINDEKMFVNEEYHDRIYNAVLSLHETFIALMPIKTIYYITNIIKIPQMHLYIVFSCDVPYEYMKQTINTLIIRKLANQSIKISSIYWKKIKEEDKNELDEYLDQRVFNCVEMDGKGF